MERSIGLMEQKLLRNWEVLRGWSVMMRSKNEIETPLDLATTKSGAHRTSNVCRKCFGSLWNATHSRATTTILEYPRRNKGDTTCPICSGIWGSLSNQIVMLVT